MGHTFFTCSTAPPWTWAWTVTWWGMVMPWCLGQPGVVCARRIKTCLRAPCFLLDWRMSATGKGVDPGSQAGWDHGEHWGHGIIDRSGWNPISSFKITKLKFDGKCWCFGPTTLPCGQDGSECPPCSAGCVALHLQPYFCLSPSVFPCASRRVCLGQAFTAPVTLTILRPFVPPRCKCNMRGCQLFWRVTAVVAMTGPTSNHVSAVHPSGEGSSTSAVFSKSKVAKVHG